MSCDQEKRRGNIDGALSKFSFLLDVYTEETLADHEHQVASMKSYYNDNKELFKLVDKREALWKKKIEFEVLSNFVFLFLLKTISFYSSSFFNLYFKIEFMISLLETEGY